MSSEAGARSGVDPAAVALRAEVRELCAARARWLRLVRSVTAAWERRWLVEEQGLGVLLPVPLRYTPAQVHALVVDEVVVVTGLSRWAAGRLVTEACAVAAMPGVLDALAAGRLDADRVTYLAHATHPLSEDAAATVARVVLAGDAARLRTLGISSGVAGVWDLATVPAWRQRVLRAVARERAKADEQVWVVVPRVVVRVDDPISADLVFTGTVEDVTRLKHVLEDLAETLPTDLIGPHGRPLRADEREAVALLRLCSGDARPDENAPGRGRRHDLGVVLHADTLLEDGPAASDLGQVRGLGTPVPVAAPDVRYLAGRALTDGATTCLLLTDDHGQLVRMLRIGVAPAGGWTRDTLVAAGRAAMATAATLATDAHQPTTAIDAHVRTAHPVSVAPGTGSATRSGSRTVDLDHCIPHPRGPTSVENLQPLHRTPHRRKTRGTWRCRTPGDGTIVWTTRTGTTWTHVPEPLPGHAPGEAYATVP